MGSRPLPLPLAEHVQELCGRPSGCVDRENGRLDRPGVVSEPLRVEFLIETLDHRRIFREEPAESDRCDHLAVGHRSEEHTLNSSHANISYAVFCLKKKNKTKRYTQHQPACST